MDKSPKESILLLRMLALQTCINYKGLQCQSSATEDKGKAF